MADSVYARAKRELVNLADKLAKKAKSYPDFYSAIVVGTPWFGKPDLCHTLYTTKHVADSLIPRIQAPWSQSPACVKTFVPGRTEESAVTFYYFGSEDAFSHWVEMARALYGVLETIPEYGITPTFPAGADRRITFDLHCLGWERNWPPSAPRLAERYPYTDGGLWKFGCKVWVLIPNLFLSAGLLVQHVIMEIGPSIGPPKPAGPEPAASNTSTKDIAIGLATKMFVNGETINMTKISKESGVGRSTVSRIEEIQRLKKTQQGAAESRKKTRHRSAGGQRTGNVDGVDDRYDPSDIDD